MIRCGNCKDRHESVEQVKTCHGLSAKLPFVDLPSATKDEVEKAKSETEERPPSDKQMAFIQKLRAEREWPSSGRAAKLNDRADVYLTGGRDGTASELISLLLEQPKIDTASGRHTDVPEGIHYKDETYYKVQVAVHGSGRKYAKLWDGDSWAYAPGAITGLSEETKVSAEEAARFGQLYGCCCFCTRTLTDERSIKVGYGPVCADHHGLPWG